LSWIGKENDVESSLGDFGARKYDPELGRFTSVDPLWEEMPGSSPFHYCFNNPIMMRDPFGLEPDGFKNQLTDLEWQCGGEQEEASPIKKGSEYSERVKKETIRANKIAWNQQMRDRAAADKAESGLLFLADMYLHYQIGQGNPKHVNMETIDFGKSNQTNLGLLGLKVNGERNVNLFNGGINPAALAFGNVRMRYHGNDRFSIVSNNSARFDFQPIVGGSSVKRDIGNVLGFILCQNLYPFAPIHPLVPIFFGGPYKVTFSGTVYIPK
jgi:RHS repeat-associated protein